jgi:hypothetical protein
MPATNGNSRAGIAAAALALEEPAVENGRRSGAGVLGSASILGAAGPFGGELACPPLAALAERAPFGAGH